jgi:hypothetical protein
MTAGNGIRSATRGQRVTTWLVLAACVGVGAASWLAVQPDHPKVIPVAVAAAPVTTTSSTAAASTTTTVAAAAVTTTTVPVATKVNTTVAAAAVTTTTVPVATKVNTTVAATTSTTVPEAAHNPSYNGQPIPLTTEPSIPPDPAVWILHPDGTCGQTGTAEAQLDGFPVIPAADCQYGVYFDADAPPSTTTTTTAQPQVRHATAVP